MRMGRPGGEAAATVAGEGAGYLRRVCKAGFRRRVSTRRPRAAWFFVVQNHTLDVWYKRA